MVMLFILLLVLFVLSLATLRRGTDSSDGINSLEWKRRQEWHGFH